MADEQTTFPHVSDQSQVINQLITGLQIKDPKLYQALTIIAEQLGQTTRAISPIVTAVSSRIVSAAALIPPDSPGYTLTPTTIRLYWTRPAIDGVLSYEVRFGGADWDTATFILRTTSTQVDVTPFTGAAGTYRVKTMNDEGSYSAIEATINVVVVFPGAVVITGQVIDNNILLQWTPDLESFAIDYYEIQRDGVVQGTVKGTFISYFEVVSSSYTYTIIPVDIAGNRGIETSVELLVNQPPDYVLQDEHISTLNGTRTDVLLLDGPALLANVVAQTWQDHFTTRAWLDPQDQVDAGYPIYIQPADLTGDYEEVIDFGLLLSNVIAAVRFNVEMITSVGNMLTVVKLATSPDNVTYSAFSTGASQFLPSLRYLKVRLEFTASLDTVLMKLTNLIVTIAVKRENDGGEEIADAGDVLGTPVTFNKDFKDIESITCTVKTPQEPYVVVVDFADVPNPTGFNVFVFDSAGIRVTKTIEWKARGVV